MNEVAIDLRLDMRRLFAQLGEFERALCILSEAATLAEALGDRGRLAYISSYMADYLRVLRDYDRALAAGQHALDLGAALGDLSLEAMTYEHLGVIHYYLGNYDQAIDMLRRSVGSLKDKPQLKAISRANPDGVESRSRLVCCLADIGAFTEGARIAEEGVQMAEALNHPISLARAYLGMGTLHLLKGDLPQSIPLLERGRDVCDAWNLLNWRSLIASRLGYAYALYGRITEALPLLEQAVERARHTDSLVYPAAAYLQAGRRGDASTLATRVLERSREGRERGTEAVVRWLFGDIAMHYNSPDIDQAKSHYQRALTLANELGMRPLQAHCHRGLGTLYSQVGQAKRARVELSASLQMYRDMEMVFWMPETEATLANVK